MFRIRRIYDDLLPINRTAIGHVQQILRSQFPDLAERDISKLPGQLKNPLKHGFRAVLYVADDHRGRVWGFALLLHEPQLKFGYLEYISAARQITGRGIGGALYRRLRDEARASGLIGLFFECLPDDPKLCRDPEILKQNRSRLRFYERFGARPISGTAYETPVKSGQDNPPYLVFDDLGSLQPLSAPQAREIVRTILERKYAHLCSPAYVQMVVDSFRDDPVRLRPFRYLPAEAERPAGQAAVPEDQRIALVVNDRHAIHHVRERGYVEAPARIEVILEKLKDSGLFYLREVRHFSERHVTAVHEPAFVRYLKAVSARLPVDEAVYPYVFPVRNASRPPRERAIRAGYYCIDTFTPLTRNSWLAARRAVDCALTAAHQILAGQRLAYALVRPPGHHAERGFFGGFCYLNSSAVAAHHLSRIGKVAVLDIDYHHGNGTQEIFYQRPDVLTISIHGHPRFAYPYFSGFAEERGSDSGRGYNLNLPLPEELTAERYRATLEQALKRITRFKPQFLVLALGYDTGLGDPTGTWPLRADDFQQNGRLIGGLGLPTLVVQEGGYDTGQLGEYALQFFTGLWEGSFGCE
jgi:acetoin utilization deacetylase AcuC-like enzyme/GNAT superfamily N-acetyltransferase